MNQRLFIRRRRYAVEASGLPMAFTCIACPRAVLARCCLLLMHVINKCCCSLPDQFTHDESTLILRPSLSPWCSFLYLFLFVSVNWFIIVVIFNCLIRLWSCGASSGTHGCFLCLWLPIHSLAVSRIGSLKVFTGFLRSCRKHFSTACSKVWLETPSHYWNPTVCNGVNIIVFFLFIFIFILRLFFNSLAPADTSLRKHSCFNLFMLDLYLCGARM